MDSKNVIAAIALSSAVIVLYSLFFIPEQPKNSQNIDEKKIEQSTDTPSLEQKETIIEISNDVYTSLDLKPMSKTVKVLSFLIKSNIFYYLNKIFQFPYALQQYLI